MTRGLREYIRGCILRRYFGSFGSIFGVNTFEGIDIPPIKSKNTRALSICDDIFGRDVKNTFTFDRWGCS
jgi:hypothetical protein